MVGKKIIITGSLGFIYSNFIIHALQHTDWQLVSIDKLTCDGSLLNISHNADISNKRHKLYLADVCDYHMTQKIFEIEKPDIVIHAAAESNVDKSINNSHSFIQSNIVGTHSILEACMKGHMPELLLYQNTDEVMGEILEGSFKETDHINPKNPYAASKMAGELLVNAYRQTFGLNSISLRMCNIFGPRQKDKLIPTCILNILNNKKIPVYGHGGNSREWLFTKDAFYAVKFIIENGQVGEVYNIGSGVEKNNLETIGKICEIMEVKLEDSIEYVEDRKGHDRRYALDTTKLNSMGWKTKYEWEEALKYTINWYKNNNWFWRK